MKYANFSSKLTHDSSGGEIIAYLAGSQDQITGVAYEAAKEIAEHRVIEHGVPAPKEEKVEVKAEDELSEWLLKVGGEELLTYANALRKEGFSTIEALKNVGEDDLDALGITKRGHRKVILAATQALKGKPA